jgi:ribosomal protein S18 acetylase RimI-like enzyme
MPDTHSYAVRPRAADDLDGVAALLDAWAETVELADRRLRVARDPGPADHEALVVVDQTGRVVGHTLLQPIQRAEDDQVAAWRPSAEVRWGRLAVLDAEALALLAAATRGRYRPDVWSIGVAVPSVDATAREMFAGIGMRPRFTFATRTGALAPVEVHGVLIRPARPDDGEVLLELLDEMLTFQSGSSPYVRTLPVLASSFNERFARSFSGEPAATGVSQFVVAEVGGGIVGFTESWVMVDADTGLWATADRYGYIDAVGIHGGFRGRGIGRALTSATLELLAAYDVAGYALWYSVDNPLASEVWPRLGFTPLWTTYLP